jgi:hypothetical protein
MEKRTSMCAGQDAALELIRFGDAALYLDMDRREVINWSGTVRFPIRRVRKGRHNVARVRHDVWFNGPDGFVWHGVLYGMNTQVVHCKRTKICAKG